MTHSYELSTCRGYDDGLGKSREVQDAFQQDDHEDCLIRLPTPGRSLVSHILRIPGRAFEI